MQSAIMFGEAPPAIRSRLMGVLSVCIGAGPLGVLHVGWRADQVGGSAALTIIAAEGLVALTQLVLAAPELPRGPPPHAAGGARGKSTPPASAGWAGGTPDGDRGVTQK